MKSRTTDKLASLSLDLDNLWTYLKIHGDEWQSRPSYLHTFVPYILDVLEDLDLKITFFVVGADAEQPENVASLKALTQAGHELGNHSHEHEPWLQSYSVRELEDEIDRSHAAITSATGEAPKGFRGPGFSWSPDLLGVLSRREYLYDASTLPTFLGPIARMYYFWTAKLPQEEKDKRKDLFGRFGDGFRPIKPYFWEFDNSSQLLEIPVTTMPGLRTPFHFSYLAYLARFSESLMMMYLRTALTACRITGTEPSFLLHPLDVIGGDQAPELKFFPGMDLSSDAKTIMLKKVIKTIGDQFSIVSMSQHAESILERGRLRSRIAA